MPQWLEVEAGAGQQVQRYSMVARLGDYSVYDSPKSWSFQVWDGAAWVTVDERSDVYPWSSGETKEFELASLAVGSRFRVYITEVGGRADGSSYAVLKEVSVYGCACKSIRFP